MTESRTIQLNHGAPADKVFFRLFAELFAFLTSTSQAQGAGAVAETGQDSRKRWVNEEAERLLDAYGDSVLRLAYSYLHNLMDAEDVLQDVLVQFLRTKPHFDSESREKAWLFTVAANLCRNRLKREKLHHFDELKEELAAEQREDLSFVWDAVRQLPVHLREAVHLFYCEGYSTSQIAGILNRKEATVRSDLRRGRLALKKVLREVYDFGESL